MELEKNYLWKIVKIKEEAPEVRSIFLSAVEERPEFVAGQYLTIKLPDMTPVEGKAYSIASTPGEDLIRITVRSQGSFSRAINQLKLGQNMTTSAPYGYFYPELEDTNPLVFLVGGIGITPCFSIIKDLLEKNDNRPLHLFYSNQTEADIVFAQELLELHDNFENFIITNYITREATKTVGYRAGRMTAEQVLNDTNNLMEPEFFICGSIGFTRELWSTLKKSGIPHERLYTEGFY